MRKITLFVFVFAFILVGLAIASSPLLPNRICFDFFNNKSFCFEGNVVYNISVLNNGTDNFTLSDLNKSSVDTWKANYTLYDNRTVIESNLSKYNETGLIPWTNNSKEIYLKSTFPQNLNFTGNLSTIIGQIKMGNKTKYSYWGSASRLYFDEFRNKSVWQIESTSTLGFSYNPRLALGYAPLSANANFIPMLRFESVDASGAESGLNGYGYLQKGIYLIGDDTNGINPNPEIALLSNKWLDGIANRFSIENMYYDINTGAYPNITIFSTVSWDETTGVDWFDTTTHEYSNSAMMISPDADLILASQDGQVKVMNTNLNVTTNIAVNGNITLSGLLYPPRYVNLPPCHTAYNTNWSVASNASGLYYCGSSNWSRMAS